MTMTKLDFAGYFKTVKRLQVAIDHKEKVDGMEEYLDNHFAYLCFDMDGGRQEKALNGKLFEVPYWALEGSIEYSLSPYFKGRNDDYSRNHTKDDPDYIRRRDYDPEKLMAQYMTGYYEPFVPGDVAKIEGKDYEYLTALSLGQEWEHQAEDGKCALDYRGNSYMRVWLELEEVKEDGKE
jgi:hypothetical protein